VVGISTVTDPYQPPERRFMITRMCLERLRAAEWPVCVLTKSDLVVRDLDVLETLPECEVGFTVTTLDEHQRRLMEPGASSVARRLAAMRYLSSAGVQTYAFIGPIYPMAKLSELRSLVRQVHEAGARSVLVDRLNLKRGVWSSVTRALSADPSLMAIARRRMFRGEGDVDFYALAFATVREEAEALGIAVSRA
jgi:DNA repair photolyase